MFERTADLARLRRRQRFLNTVLFLATTVMAVQSHAAELLGEVVGIADGDTVTVLDGNRVQHRIRLRGIDAPEKRQAFGQRSRQALSDLVFRQPVRVEWEKRDRYKRIIGTLWVAPPNASCRGKPSCAKTLDASLVQIEAGLAWWYRKYASQQSREARESYRRAETVAKEAGAGLWKEPSPVPPWVWRTR